MATPSKSSEPSAAAMSAIEEALNLVDFDKETGKEAAKQSSVPVVDKGAAHAEKAQSASGDAPRLPNVGATDLSAPAVAVKAPEANGSRLRDERKRDDERKPETAEAAALRSAANDDRPSVGQILQALQERPSATPYVLATLVSLAWLGVAGLYAYSLFTSGQWPLPVSQAALLGLGAFGPVAFFFATASLARRAQEMRMTARSMQQVAIRLAEPETVATEQVVTLSQAIRREVASMGDGIERALARASELETVLRSEVTNLERSYGDNERRIRSLIDELASEREAIIGNADRLRQSITGAHEKLSQELEVTSVRISERVEETGSRVTSSLGSKAEEINLMLARNGDTIVERIGAQSGAVIDKLTASGENVSSRLTEVTDRLTETLSSTGKEVVSRIQAQGEAFSTNFTDTGNGLAERIGAETARIVGKLDDAGENLGRNLSETSIGVTVSLTALGESLVSRLNSESEKVTTNVGRLSDNLLHGLDDAARRIGEAIGGGEAIATRLSSTADQLSQSVDVRGAALTASLGEAGERIEQTFIDRTSAAAEMLESTTAALANQVSESFSKLSEGLASQAVGLKTTLATANEDIDKTFAARTRTATELLESSSEGVATRITDAVERLSENLALHGVGLNTALSAAGERIDHVFATRTHAGVEAMESSSAALSSRIDESVGRLSQDLLLHSVGLETAVTSATDRIEQTLGEKSRSAVESLEKSGEHIVHRLTTQSFQIYDRFTAAATDAVSAIGTHSDRVNETLADRIGAFETTFATRADVVADRVAERAREAATLMEKQLADFDAASTLHTQTLSDAFARYVQDFGSTAETRAQGLAKTLDDSARGFSDVADRSARELTETLRERLAALDEAASSRGSVLEQTLSGLIERIDTGLIQRLQNMSDGISKQALEASRVLDQSARKVSDVLDPSAIEATISGKIRDLNVTLAERSREVLDNLREGAKAFETALDTDALNAALGGKVGELRSLLSDHSRDLVTQMTDNARALREALDPAAMEAAISARLTQVEQTLAERSRSIVETIDAQAAALHSATDPQRLEGALSDRIAQLNSAVAQRNTELLSTLVEGARAVERALNPDALEQMFSTRIQEIGETIETRGRTLDDSLRLVTQRGADLADQAASATELLTTTLNASGQSLLTAIETSAAASVRSLTGANEKLRNDLPALLENLAATNRSLQDIIDQAGTSFHSIEGALGERIGDFRHSLDTLSDQVGSLSRTADAAVDSAGSLSQRLENQSRELAESATVLAQTQLQLDSSLATRQASLEQLLESVQSRTEGFETAVHAFTQMVEDSFTAAEKRSRDIGMFLATETRNVAGLIGKQYEEVRNASETERERSLESVRETYEATVADMNRTFEHATERFRDGAIQMRSVTAEIKCELDATRDEIRRGALELPKETSEQTATVRRVLAEQVRALNDLTKMIDLSGRAFGEVKPLPARAEPTRAIAAQPQPARPATPVAQPSRTPTPQPERPAAPIPVMKSDGRGAGWLSDLLARASQDDEGAHGSDPVADLARNIGHYIDHESAVSVWDRYYRGDQNVFSREMYSVQGQLAFEDARRRYRSDPPFHDAVDRFAEEFERQVQKVGSEDRDGSLIRSQLTSESGKTYTLLAHAAGRFDGA